MKKLIGIVGIVFLMLISCSKKEAAVKPEQTIDPAGILKQANELYNQGDIEHAFRLYGDIYTNYPTSNEYIDAVLGLSRCYNEMGKYEKGLDLLYNLVRENMIPSRVPEIYNEMAKYFEINAGISSLAGFSDESSDYEKAIGYYQKAIDYPNSDDKVSKAYAQYKIGELNLKLEHFKDAVRAYKLTVQNYPGTEWAEKANLRLDEFRKAVDEILQEIKTAPPSAPGTTAPATSNTGVAAPDTTQKPLPAPKPAPLPKDTSKTVTDTSRVLPADTTQTVPADTSQKPELDLK